MIHVYFVYFLYIFDVCYTAQIDFFFLVLFNILNFNVSNYEVYDRRRGQVTKQFMQNNEDKVYETVTE